MKLKKTQKAMIIGSGVIGAYLSSFLLKKGFKLIVTSRKIKKRYDNYSKLKIEENVKFKKLNLLNKENIKKIIISEKPQYIYYFAGVSSITRSFKCPKQTLNSNFLGAKNFLEVLKELNSPIKFFKANSGYIFNGNNSKISLKSKLIKPDSPYTYAQIKAYNLVKKFRSDGLKCYSIIFFNIESPLRPSSFFIKKICLSIKKIKNKKIKKIEVGNINSVRDFGWAPEIMQGIYLMSKLNPCDLLLGTGKKMSIKKAIKYAFNYQKISFKKYVKINKKFFRKNEKKMVVASMTESFKKLGRWKPKIFGRKLIVKMYNNC